MHSSRRLKQFTFGAIMCIWVRSQRCGCLVTWFCYQLMAKPGNKTAVPLWPDPYSLMCGAHKWTLLMAYLEAYPCWVWKNFEKYIMSNFTESLLRDWWTEEWTQKDRWMHRQMLLLHVMVGLIRTLINNFIPYFSMGCNYSSMPQIEWQLS